MTKDAKDRLSRKRTSGAPRSGWIALFCVLAIVVCSTIAFIHEIKKSPETSTISNAYLRLTDWIAAHKKHINKEIVKVQQLTAKTEPEKIHFEFYTALPKMKMSETVAVAEEKETQAIKPVGKPKLTASKAAANSAYMGADELEREFSKHLKEKNGYVIQLGTFQEKSAAEHYRNKLLEDGFDAYVVAVSMDSREIYRVQAGPYTDKEQARFSQRQLQKKGLNGLLRKIQM